MTTSPPPLTAARCILLWRAGALGDTLLLLPALTVLRAAAPDSTLIVVGTLPAVRLLARPTGPADLIWDAAQPVFGALWQTALPPNPTLRDYLAGVDLAIVWSAAAHQIEAGLRHHGVKATIAVAALPQSTLHVADYVQSTLAPLLGTSSAPMRHPPLRIVTQRAARPSILLHPGSGGQRKLWPLASFLSLAARLEQIGVAVSWSLGPADEAQEAGLRAAHIPQETIIRADLPALAAHCARQWLLVAGDTGVAHLAAAAGCHALVLFGSTDPHQWAPPYPWVTVIAAGSTCVECVGESCQCLAALPVANVEAQARQILEAVGQASAGA